MEFPVHFLFLSFEIRATSPPQRGQPFRCQPVSGSKALWLSAERICLRAGWKRRFILGSIFSSQSFSAPFPRWYLRPCPKSQIAFTIPEPAGEVDGSVLACAIAPCSAQSCAAPCSSRTILSGRTNPELRFAGLAQGVFFQPVFFLGFATHSAFGDAFWECGDGTEHSPGTI